MGAPSGAGKVDQLACVAEMLKADPSSRRDPIQLYDLAQDAAGDKEVPCSLGSRCHHLRDGRLRMATMAAVAVTGRADQDSSVAIALTQGAEADTSCRRLSA
ncbi:MULTISPECIES: hypothetical protein [unclassified Streptomyces]|uniref:hypothetical protein n=1 Tax=unclassified Streptomyces TaxID=2593676 RepID=UPI0030785719